ncbi:MAG: AEC family transporter [Arenicellales bacterium]|nr:AEC family transporter [Arenicellales bacterium]
MLIAEAVVLVVLPVFGVVVLGYVVGALRWLDRAAVRGLSLYVFNIAIPLLLFRSMAIVDLPDSVPWRYIAGYFGCALVFFGSCLWLARRLFSHTLAESGVFAFGCSYGNFIPLGIPLVLTAFGEQAAVPLFMMVAIQAPLFFPLMIAVQEGARQGSVAGVAVAAALKGVVANQYLAGIVLGALVNFAGVSLPGPVDDILALVGRSAVPCALFALGASLSYYRISGALPAAVTMVMIKNVALPLAIWQIAERWLGLEPLWQAVMVLMAALPVGINTYLFAERYDSAVAVGGTATVLSTAVSVLTISLVLASLKLPL